MRRGLGGLCRLATTWLLAGAVIAALLSSNHVFADDARKSTRSDAPKRVQAILEQIKARYVEPIDDDKLIADAVNGVLKTLDSHSVYLDAEAFRQLQQESRGLYGGVGMEVGLDAGSVKVLATFEGTPAFRAGLLPGDVITRVEGAKVDGMGLEQVSRRVRGEPETDVALTILRQGEPGPRTITLNREAIQGRGQEAKAGGAMIFRCKECDKVFAIDHYNDDWKQAAPNKVHGEPMPGVCPGCVPKAIDRALHPEPAINLMEGFYQT